MSETLNKRQKEEASDLISSMCDVCQIKSSNTLIAKNGTLMNDFINTCFINRPAFETGSGAEGIIGKESDTDYMTIADGAIVQMSSNFVEKKYEDRIVFFMDTTNNSPGYTRLKLIHIDNTRRQLLDSFRCEGKDGVYDCLSVGSYLSHEFVGLLTSEKFLKVGLGGTRVIRNGPCNTYESVDVFGYSRGIPGQICSVDVATAIRCESWPAKIKNSWLTRGRHTRTWPTTDMLNKIVQSPCVVVPVCEKGSDNQFEWRISFVLGELQLMWSLNDTQLRVIFILKKLLKIVINPKAPDQLSSYNMKTVCFWVMEKTGLSVWTPKNLLFCLEKCLDYLADCVKRKQLSHYINDRANLLRNKLNKNSDIVLKQLQDIKANILLYVLQCCGPVTQVHVSQSCVEKSEHLHQKLFYNYKYLQATLVLLVRLRLNFSDHRQTTIKMIDLQNKLESSPPDGVDKYFINYSKLFVLLELFRHQTSGCNIDFHTTIQTCKCQLMATNTNTVLAELYLCTAYFQEGNYLLSSAIIKSIWNTEVFYIPSKNTSFVIVAEFKETGSVTKKSCLPPGHDVEKISFVFNMIFNKHDTQSVSYPLKFECALLDEKGQNVLAVINPFIYVHFLQCLGYYKLSDSKAFESSLKSLHKTVDLFCELSDETKKQETKVCQRFRAMNLLAYCFTLNGDYKSALKYLSKSIYDTEEISKSIKTKVPNAAYYHVALLVYNCHVALLVYKMLKDEKII